MIKTESVREPNLWEGIFYFPDAVPESKFMATTIEGRRMKTIGLFACIEDAVAARARYIEYHANKPMRETATCPQDYETRPY